MKKEYILGIEIQRKKVKNINLRVKEDLSIYISAPINLDNIYIERFIISKKKWIENAKHKIKKYTESIVDDKFQNNSKIKFLSKVYTILIILSDKNKLILDDEKNLMNIYTKSEDKETIKRIYENFLYIQANIILPKLLNKWKKIMNLEFERLIIKPIKGKWGYCNYYKKVIALNTKLMQRSIFEIEYVIVHELSHLKFPDHSKNFYNHIQKYIKDYKKAEELLKYR